MNDKRGAESVFAARSSAKVLQRMLSAAAVLFVLCLVFAAPASAEVWDGISVDTDWYSESSSATEFTILTAAQLAGLAQLVNGGTEYFDGKTIELGADIDLGGKPWTPIGIITQDHGFMGDFDGKTYKISNLNITNFVPDSDGWVYAGLFGITEGEDGNQNVIKNLTIENVKVSTTGAIVAAAIAYPYYTVVDNITVCGDISITGGDYTSGVLAYTRLCIDASNLYVVGNEESTISGQYTVGGVISDIQMNHELTAQYSNFCASGVTITGEMHVGGISGIISSQTLTNAKVENVVLICEDSRVGAVSGSLGGVSTITGITVTNVDGALSNIGCAYDNGKPVEARIGDTYYSTLEKAIENAGNGGTVTLAQDVERTETLTILAGTEVTLDLAGHVLSGVNTEAKASALIENKGNLTVKDSVGNGKITSDALHPDTDWEAGTEDSFPTYANNAIANRGKLTLESGTIECTAPAGGATYAIDNYEGGSIVVNGGKIYNPNNIAIRLFAGGTVNALTVNDGDINGTRALWIQLPSNTPSVSPTVNVTVNGGTLTGSKIDSSDNKLAIYSYSYGMGMGNVNITITGGTFNGDVALTGGANKNSPIETVTVTGGEFTGRWGCVYSYADDAVAKETMSITGGWFNDKTDIESYLADGYAVTGSDEEGYTVCLEAEITGPATVTEDVAAVFKANSSIRSLDNAKFVWSVDGTVVGGFTGNSLEYTFADSTGEETPAVISVVAELEDGQKAVGSFDVTVEAAKEIPKEEDQIQAGIEEETDSSEGSVNNNADFGSVNFSNQDVSGQTITLAVKGNTEEKVKEHKELIPSAKKIVASYNITAIDPSTTTDIHNLEQMAVVKISVRLESELNNGEKLQAYRFNEEKDIKAMPLKTEYYLNRSADQYTYEVTIYTPGFSDFTVAQEETVTPGFELVVNEDNLNIDETQKPFIFKGGTLTLPVIFKVTDDTADQPNTYNFVAKVYNESNNNEEVTGLGYTYTASPAYGGGHDANNAYSFGSGSELTDNTQLFSLAIAGENLNAGSNYRVEIDVKATYTQAGDEYGQSGATYSFLNAKLEQQFAVKSWLISETDNRLNKTASGEAVANPWNFTNPVIFEYIVYAGDYTGNDWPTVKRTDVSDIKYLNESASSERKAAVHPLAFKDTQVSVQMTERAYTDASGWIAAQKVHVTNSNEKFNVVVSEAATPAYLKLTFTGYCMGDVIGTDNVIDLADVDVLIQEITKDKKGTYIADARKIYADINADGNINSDDIFYLFKHYRGLDTNNIEELTITTA